MTAIVNGKLYTVTNGVVERGVILVDGGKIVAVGRDIAPPEGARIIDAEGCSVTPGFIDAHTHLSVWGEPYLPSTDDDNEMTNPVTPYLRALDALNPHDPAIPLVRAAGFTTVYTGPGSANVICGTGLSIKLRGDTAEEMAIPGSEQMKMALGENPKRVYGGKDKMPSTRMGVAGVLRRALHNARVYAEKLEKGKTDEKKQPDRDFELEALLPVIRGEQKARIHCHRADDIVTAVRIAEEFGLDFSIEHATEGYKIAEFLAQRKVDCVVGPLLIGPAKHELWNHRLENAARLISAGVSVCFTADESRRTAWLPMEVGLLLRRGLSEEAAFQGLTMGPARLLGISHRTGSLEPGKDADIAIFDGFPFSNLTLCRLTMIDGEICHDTMSQNMG